MSCCLQRPSGSLFFSQCQLPKVKKVQAAEGKLRFRLKGLQQGVLFWPKNEPQKPFLRQGFRQLISETPPFKVKTCKPLQASGEANSCGEMTGGGTDKDSEAVMLPYDEESQGILQRHDSINECVSVPIDDPESGMPSSSGRERGWPFSWNLEGTKGGLVGLALGQLLSLLVTATGLTSAVLAQKGVNIPTTQAWLNYLLLTLVYGGLMLKRRRRPQVPWYIYVLLALIDVEANFLVVRAYQFTSITSVMLLDCFTIPCVLLLTRLFLKTRYQARHFAGVALCLSGLVLLVLSDVHSADRGGGSAVLLGDLLVLGAASLYACSNVGEEALVQQVDSVELLAMVGAYGLGVNTLQLLLLERKELALMRWSWATMVPFGGFSLALFSFYSLVPFMLQMSGSALFNLSLLTSDMWAVALRALVFRQPVDWLYFVAFFAVSIGLVLYTRGEDDDKQDTKPAVTSKYLRLDTYWKSSSSSQNTSANATAGVCQGLKEDADSDGRSSSRFHPAEDGSTDSSATIQADVN